MLNIYYTRKPKNISTAQLQYLHQKISNYLKINTIINKTLPSLLGYLLLYRALKEARQLDLLLELTRSETGKPFIKNSHWHFNISHSGDYVVCAISDESEIGIDIQIYKNLNINAYQRHFTESEWQQLTDAPDSSKAFCQLWSQKESIMKADGRGLDIPLRTIEVKGKKPFRLDKKLWFLSPIKIDKNYAAYLATQYKPKQLKLIEIFFSF
jgi:4'-phosphopantetheinyl transferase